MSGPPMNTTKDYKEKAEKNTRKGKGRTSGSNDNSLDLQDVVLYTTPNSGENLNAKLEQFVTFMG